MSECGEGGIIGFQLGEREEQFHKSVSIGIKIKNPAKASEREISNSFDYIFVLSDLTRTSAH